MKHRRMGALAPALAGVAAAALAIAGPATAAPQSLVQLRGSSPRAAAPAPRVGSVANNSRIAFEVDLKLRNQQGAQAFALAVSTPGNSQYGKYLTTAQWEARFSPSATAVSRVKSFLRSSGFKVGRTSPDRMAIRASGTAQQIEQAFATSLGEYKVHGKTVRLAERNLSVPSDIAGLVAGVSGVSENLAHPDNTTGAGRKTSAPSATAAAIKQPAGFRVAQPCSSYYGEKTDTTLPAYGNGYPDNPPWAVCGYTPPQFRSAYGLTGGNDGSGETVAIVDAYASPTLLSDAQRFASDNDPSNPLPSSHFSELVSPSFTETRKCDASGWFGEQTLDVEAVHATAPGANIVFAGAQSCLTTATNAALRTIVDGHLADVITNSYGDNGGDLLDSSSDRASTDDILLMAAGTGISVLFSSGDFGDEYTTVGTVTPDYPASSPYATAVGGSTLQVGSSGSRTGEFGWSTARSFLCDATWAALGGCATSQEGTWLPIDLTLDGGSGGGTSYVYPQPPYQAGVVPTSLAEANGSSSPMRVEPDISMDADPATGMLEGETQTFPDGTYYDTYRIGGTSVSSPLMAGVIARADETAGRSLGFLNPALYSLSGNYGTPSGTGALYDIGPAGKQDMSRADYVNSVDSTAGLYYTTRIIDYEGPEQFCGSTAGRSKQHVGCATRDVALNTAPGYDNMTGLGSPGAGFVADLATAK